MKKMTQLFIFPLGFIKSGILNLPANYNLSYMWNFGSMLGIILSMQIISGILLSMNYCSDSSLAFYSVINITREAFFGFFLRWFHLNTASLFFLVVYLHIFRGMFYNSFRLFLPWLSGTTILLILMGTAFMGYVLPWGQMSLWGATVITNLVSTVPIIGQSLVIWIWGGYSVNTYTLGLFFSLHFLLPFLLLGVVIIHILGLHETGSSSKLMLHTSEMKMKFHFLFTVKDIINVMFVGMFLLFIYSSPYKLGDPENFTLANSLSSPLHIQPEWYFLFAYAILRSIPNKLGGVVALVLSVVLLYTLPFFSQTKEILMKYHKIFMWVFFGCCLILTWIGGNPVEEPYIFIGRFFTLVYFVLLYLIAVF